ncbi:OpgC domain-containing protein [Roseococcus sp. DSY-14]|uniref:OpgC domain-containing protein n=1 Tax=Roseococcus sp. DSY-14 TaxID=3369650 RepID=UPI00387B005E
MGRDGRADVFRGLALWMIVVNHTPGNVLGQVTLKNWAFADATEIFVLLAGYAGAFAYAGVADREGWAIASARAVRRIGKLYVTHIFLLVVFTAQVGLSAATLDRAAYLDELALDPFAEDPYRTLLEALMLRFQPAFLDILPLYIVLLALLPAMLALRRRPWLMLALSVLVWAGARQLDLNLPRWREGGWFFNPLGWQLLFVLGFLVGQGARGAPSLPWPAPSRALSALAAAILLGCAAVLVTEARLPAAMERLPDALPAFLASVDKTALHPLRLLSVLALLWLVARHVPRDAAWLRARWAWPFTAMGRHSLPVFCFGILLSFLARLALEVEDGPAMQWAVNILCLAALMLTGLLADWQQERPRATVAPAMRAAALLLPLLLLAAPAAAQPACPAVPEEVIEAARPLPATLAALNAGTLRVLVLGSASVTGPGGSGPEHSWPARLQALLAAAHPQAVVEVAVRGGRGVSVQDHLALLRQEGPALQPQLVVWQAGTVEAARGADPEEMTEALTAGLDRIRRRGADAILVDMQWSRFLRGNANVEPYRDKLRLAAGGAGAALFRRWELMESWADAGALDLERTPPAARRAALDRLNDCLARSLASLVARGLAEAR